MNFVKRVKKKNVLIYILAGALLGTGLSFRADLLLALGLFFFTGGLLWKFADSADRKILLTLFVLGLAIRLILGLTLHLGFMSIGHEEGAMFLDDAGWPTAFTSTAERRMVVQWSKRVPPSLLLRFVT